MTWRHAAQESLLKSPRQTDGRASRAIDARVFQTGTVVNAYEALSAITLAEHSSAENDEQRRRADGCAGIALGKAFERELKARKKACAERGRRHDGEERFGGQRQRPAICEEDGFVMREHDGAARVCAERRMSDIVIMARRVARAGDRRRQPKEDHPEAPAEA
jgi:hypothetical protein